MGEFTGFMNELRKDPRIGKIRFNPGFLKEVSDILYLRGFNEARLFVWDLRGQGALEGQILPLLLILEKMENTRALKEDRELRRYILEKKLGFLLRNNS
jgi:hypothetical protein